MEKIFHMTRADGSSFSETAGLMTPEMPGWSEIAIMARIHEIPGDVVEILTNLSNDGEESDEPEKYSQWWFRDNNGDEAAKLLQEMGWELK